MLVSTASVPERSKGFDSSSNVFVLVGSNPTGCMFYYFCIKCFFHKSLEWMHLVFFSFPLAVTPCIDTLITITSLSIPAQYIRWNINTLPQRFSTYIKSFFIGGSGKKNATLFFQMAPMPLLNVFFYSNRRQYAILKVLLKTIEQNLPVGCVKHWIVSH